MLTVTAQASSSELVLSLARKEQGLTALDANVDIDPSQVPLPEGGEDDFETPEIEGLEGVHSSQGSQVS